MINPKTYEPFNRYAPYIGIWIGIFFITTLYRIYQKEVNNVDRPYSTLISELPAAPVSFFLSLSFFLALYYSDWLSALLFAWWGPGFIICVLIYFYGYLQKFKIPWKNYATQLSWACKLNYLLLMLAFYYMDCPWLMFIFSIWIINDQINMAWFGKTADRTRRTTEDSWFPRIFYLAFLFIPFFYPEMQYSTYAKILGIAVFIVYLVAMNHIRPYFFDKPKDSSEFLRNIVYDK